MKDYISLELPIALCAVTLPFTGILSKPFNLIRKMINFVLKILLSMARGVICFALLICAVYKSAGENSGSKSSEYKRRLKQIRKAEHFFRISFADFMITRDKKTWPHVEINISMGKATVMVYDRSLGGIRLEPVKYVYRLEDGHIITENGQIMTKDDFQCEIDDLLSPHTIEPPSPS